MTNLISKAEPIDPRASQVNPNSEWLNLRGAWVMNLLVLALARLFFGVLPGISNEAAWTLTNILYLVAHFVVFHMLIGTPFDTAQGEFDGLTLWEQIDNGQQFTPTKKFLTALPILFFLLSAHYTHYDGTLFFVNLVPLVVVLIAKLPALHRVRFFGINKLD